MKKIIIIVLLVFIYVLIALGMEYYVGNDIYLFIGSSARFHYSDGKWTNDEGKPSYSKFQVYNTFTNKKIGTRNVKYNDGWYIRTKNQYIANNDVILFKGKGKLKILSYEETYVSDDRGVEKVLKKYNLPIKEYNGYYISIDIDNDGDNEKIYSLKNYYDGIYFERDVYYSLVYILDDGNMIELSYDKSNTQPNWSYTIPYIIDLNNDDNYEILVSKTTIDSKSSAKLKMYGLQDGKYVKLVSTE